MSTPDNTPASQVTGSKKYVLCITRVKKVDETHIQHIEYASDSMIIDLPDDEMIDRLFLFHDPYDVLLDMPLQIVNTSGDDH